MYKDFKKSESLDTGFVGGSGIIWMFSGIVLGLLFGLGMYYFSNDRTPRISIVDSLQKKIENAQSNKSNSFKGLVRTAIPENQAQKKQLSIPDQKKPREHKFSYYAVLPTIDVPVGSTRPINTESVESKKSSTIDAFESQSTPDLQTTEISLEINEQDEPASLGDYLLQVASFKKESMADKTRGRLSNKGIDAYVQKRKVKGHYWYRVVAGPVDQNSVDNWKHTAEKLGHRPLVISVR